MQKVSREKVNLDELIAYVRNPEQHKDNREELIRLLEIQKERAKEVDDQLNETVKNKFLRNRVRNIIGLEGVNIEDGRDS